MKPFIREKNIFYVFFSVESKLEPWAFNLIVGTPYVVTMPDGRNIRKTIADIIHSVQQKIFEVDEGDTKSTKNIITVSYKKKHIALRSFTVFFFVCIDLQHNLA